MAQRSVVLYGMGISEDAQPPQLEVSLAGAVVYTGAATAFRSVLEDGNVLSMEDLADNSIGTFGEHLAQFFVDGNAISGQTTLKVRMIKGCSVVASLGFDQTAVENLDQAAEPFLLVPGTTIPVEMAQRLLSKTHTQDDINWISPYILPNQSSGNKVVVPYEDNKSNVFINGEAREPGIPVTGDDPVWQWVLREGDVFECTVDIPLFVQYPAA